MLKREDCKPGVEVIAIKNNPSGDRPLLAIGDIYTIGQLHDYILEGGNGNYKDKPCVNISIVEMPIAGHLRGKVVRFGWDLDQFKLRRKEEFTELFQTSDENLKKFREVEEYV